MIATALLASVTLAQAQGTVTFNGAALFSGTVYTESGMMFQVMLPQGGTPDYMAGTPAITGPSNVPYNSTPYMNWLRQFNSYDYVSLNLNGGSTFGLTSVQLADPTSPSPSPVSISFVGYLPGGGSITNTFITPGNGATTFASYTFSPEFSLGFTQVDILAPRWAMDNLVFSVPEPSTLALAGLGALALVRWRRKL